jgi:hypothetical protein
MQQPPLFPNDPPSRHPHDPIGRGNPEPNINPDEAKRKRDEAMERVDQGANRKDPEWAARARAAIVAAAQDLPELTSEDVWRRLDKPDEGRALGPQMMSARRDGLITPSGRFQSTGMVTRNAAPVCVWRSLLYRAAQ